MTQAFKNNPDTKSRFKILKNGKISLVVSALIGSVTVSIAAPSGGVVTSGNVNIVQSGTVTNINQSTQKASINWRKFSIASGETVNFNQPNRNSITLNRVIGNERSIINGALNANGQVWLLNSNGVLFGKNARVNTAGILASTKNLSDDDFNSGNYIFKGNSHESVINLGVIDITDSGYAALLASNVSNEGTIKAVRGKVHLVGAEEVSISLNGNSLIELTIKKGVLDALVENKGAVYAKGGEIYFTTNAVDELLKGVVNNTGIIEAQSFDDISGKIELFAHGGTANVGGILDASAPESGDGGFIETSGDITKFSDDLIVTTLSKEGSNGTWLIDPKDFTIASSGGDMTGATLSTNLGLGNVEIQSVNGATDGNGDININDDITWTNNTLTLTATNDVNIQADLNAGGTNSELVITKGGEINFIFNNDNTFAGQVNFTGSGNTLTIDGENYTIVKSLTELQDMNNALSLNYALGAEIDASITSTWNAGEGFNPIGDNSTIFEGDFDGLGHTVDNLYINRNQNYVGLFGVSDYGTKVSNLRLTNVDIFAGNGGGALFGQNSSYVSNIYASGISSSNGYSGGISGFNFGTFDGVINEVDVTSPYAGGITGSSRGTIKNSYSNAHITGINFAGGLVASGDGIYIYDSYASGIVESTDNTSGIIGGLVGQNVTFSGAIKNSYSNAQLVGGSIQNALLGKNFTGRKINFTSSYWNTDKISALNPTGGEGKTLSELSNSFLFINNNWEINADSTLADSAPILRNGKWYMAPEIVNYTLSDLNFIYDGTKSLDSLYSSFFDVNYGLSYGTDYQFKDNGSVISSVKNVATYDDISVELLNQNVTLGSSNTDGNIVITPKEVTVTYSADNKVYDGTTTTTVNDSTGDLISGDTVTISESASFDTKDVGTAKTVSVSSIALSGADASNYTLTATTDTTTANINKKQLTISGLSASNKIYDGATSVTVSNWGALTTGVGTETLTLNTGTASFENKDVGTSKIVTAVGYSLSDGSNGGIQSNYELSSTTSTTSADIIAKIQIPQTDTKAKKTITAIVNSVSVTPPVVQKTSSQNFTTTKINFGNKTDKVTIVSKPMVGEKTKKITQAEVKEMQGSDTTVVPIGRNALIQLIDSGVSLPEGVEQEFYVVDDRRR